jgi:hypothetical protein
MSSARAGSLFDATVGPEREQPARLPYFKKIRPMLPRGDEPAD